MDNNRIGLGGGGWKWAYHRRWAAVGDLWCGTVAILLGCQIGCHGVRGEYVCGEDSVHLSVKFQR